MLYPRSAHPLLFATPINAQTRPSDAEIARMLRSGGYVAAAATLLLGFLWIGFDSEKRGLHDWIAGTYVIRA